MMEIQKHIEKMKIEKFYLTVDNEYLIHLINKIEKLKIPKDALVYIEVPGGGDWSNIDLEVSSEHKIHIVWSVTTNETSP